MSNLRSKLYCILIKFLYGVEVGCQMPCPFTGPKMFCAGQSMTEAVFFTLGQSQSSLLKKLGLRPKA